jgi:hypothetical protein
MVQTYSDLVTVNNGGGCWVALRSAQENGASAPPSTTDSAVAP